MKIRLALLERDRNYLDAVCSSFETKYPDKLEIYSFTDLETALSALRNAKIDVFLADASFEVDEELLPSRCAFSCLTDMRDVDSVKGHRAVCKFQKADLIYKYILNLYSEKTENVFGFGNSSSKAKVVLFDSVSGGAGASSMAAAASMRFAGQGKKVLYLNLEKYGSAELFFEGNGQLSMSDVIFSLKSRKEALGIKLESCAKCDVSGVFFYSPPKIALDMAELDCGDIVTLLKELKTSGEYDCIITDIDRAADKDFLPVYREAHNIIWVGDGSPISNNKLARAYKSLAILEQSSDTSLCCRISLIYNKFSNKTGQTLAADIGIHSLGGAPKREGTDPIGIARWLSEMNMLDNIIA